MRYPAEVILTLAFIGAAFIFWRLHKQKEAQGLPAGPAGAPPGTPFLALGQYAAEPDKRWLFLQPGQ